jgi:hypothetical protein
MAETWTSISTGFLYFTLYCGCVGFVVINGIIDLSQCLAENQGGRLKEVIIIGIPTAFQLFPRLRQVKVELFAFLGYSAALIDNF